MRDPPASQPDRTDKAGTGTLGMTIFLASLGMLFMSSMVGYLIVRLNNEAWVPEQSLALPGGLWVSTFLLLLSSGTLHYAWRSAHENRQAGVSFGLAATLLLGILFLAGQTLAWFDLLEAMGGFQRNLYAFTFFFLTGLHAVHVVGGLIPLGITTVRGFLGRYGPESYAGLKYCAMYWHFLDGVWLVLFGTLYLAT